jgi:hypothetical protein
MDLFVQKVSLDGVHVFCPLLLYMDEGALTLTKNEVLQRGYR